MWLGLHGVSWAAAVLGPLCPREPASLGHMVQASHSPAGTGIGQVVLSQHNRAPLTETVSSQKEKHIVSSFTQSK